MVHEIGLSLEEPKSLTQAVLQATEMLDMYRAELARVLGIQCADVGRLADGKSCLQPGSEAWHRAQQFVRFYNVLYQWRQGDGVAMRNWLRRVEDKLDGTPLLLIVDENRLDEVLAYVCHRC